MRSIIVVVVIAVLAFFGYRWVVQDDVATDAPAVEESETEQGADDAGATETETAPEEAESDTGSAIEDAVNEAGDAVDNAVNEAGDAVDSAVATGENLVEEATNAVNDVINDLSGEGSAIVEEIQSLSSEDLSVDEVVTLIEDSELGQNTKEALTNAANAAGENSEQLMSVLENLRDQITGQE